MRTPRRPNRRGCQEALESAEGNFTIGLALEGEMRFFDEVEEVVFPDVHLDDAPAAGKSLGEGGSLSISRPAP
jgi:hypothetical protein